MSISKTSAIREARTFGAIAGRATSWHVYVPYRSREPHGPSTELNADSYPKARRLLTGRRAYIALSLMGRLTDDAAFAVDGLLDEPYADHSLEALVAAGLKAEAGRGNAPEDD